MGRVVRRNAILGQRGAKFGVILALTVLVSGCAYRYSAKQATYEAAGVLEVAVRQVKDECQRSFEQGQLLAATAATKEDKIRFQKQGIPPFTVSVCDALLTSYKIANVGAKEAVNLAQEDKASPAQLTGAGIRFVFSAASYMAQGGIKPAEQVQDFINEASDALLKSREVN